jgi:hypothetical protein
VFVSFFSLFMVIVGVDIEDHTHNYCVCENIVRMILVMLLLVMLTNDKRSRSYKVIKELVQQFLIGS